MIKINHTFKNYLKEEATNRNVSSESARTPFIKFMYPWLFKKYGVGKDAKIVDVGAGGGEFLMTLSDAGYRNLSAIDRDDYFFDKFRSKFGFDCYKKDINYEPLPFKDESMDAIFNSLVISHLESPDNLLKESYRILRPKGLIFIITPDWRRQYKTFWRDPTHVHPYDKQGISRLLLMYGFKPEIYSWGSAFGLGRLNAFRLFPRLGLLGEHILAVSHKI
jgi:SAM-dependent methyltransferase